MPEFGTCGGNDADPAESNQEEEVKKVEVQEEEEVEEVVESPPTIKNPCYKCREKPA